MRRLRHHLSVYYSRASLCVVCAHCTPRQCRRHPATTFCIGAGLVPSRPTAVRSLSGGRQARDETGGSLPSASGAARVPLSRLLHVPCGESAACLYLFVHMDHAGPARVSVSYAAGDLLALPCAALRLAVALGLAARSGVAVGPSRVSRPRLRGDTRPSSMTMYSV